MRKALEIYRIMKLMLEKEEENIKWKNSLKKYIIQISNLYSIKQVRYKLIKNKVKAK